MPADPLAEVRAAARDVGRLGTEIDDAVADSLRKHTPKAQDFLRGEYKDALGQRTGQSAASLTARRDDGGILFVAPNSSRQYLSGQEWGQRRRWGRGRPPRYLWPAVMITREVVIEDVERRLGVAIDEFTRG